MSSLKGNELKTESNIRFHGRDDSSKASLSDRVSSVLSNLEGEPKHVKLQLEKIRAEISHLELRDATQKASDSAIVTSAKRDLKVYRQQAEQLKTENEKLKAQIEQRPAKEQLKSKSNDDQKLSS